jgi:plasmid stabilization system protein ParE
VPTVAYAATFERELAAQVVHLAEHGGAALVDRLKDDLARLRDLLARFPWSGTELTSERDRRLRKLKLRHAPFTVWYIVDPVADRVMLTRLFHGRQRTPGPRLP